MDAAPARAAGRAEPPAEAAAAAAEAAAAARGAAPPRRRDGDDGDGEDEDGDGEDGERDDDDDEDDDEEDDDDEEEEGDEENGGREGEEGRDENAGGKREDVYGDTANDRDEDDLGLGLEGARDADDDDDEEQDLEEDEEQDSGGEEGEEGGRENDKDGKGEEHGDNAKMSVDADEGNREGPDGAGLRAADDDADGDEKEEDDKDGSGEGGGRGDDENEDREGTEDNAEADADAGQGARGADGDDAEEEEEEEARDKARRARLEAARRTGAEILEKAKALRAKFRALREDRADLEDELFCELTGTGLILSSIVQGSTRWKRTRVERVTASQFGVVCGVSNFARPIDLWMLRTGRVDDPFRGNADTERGNRLEPVALKWYERTFGQTVRPTGFWVCEEASYLGASPDGLVGEDGVLEIKCPRNSPHARVPSYYMAQIQGQLHVTKRKWCDFVSYHEEMEPVVLRVYYSPEYWAWMFPQLRTFYFHIQTDEPPAQLPLEQLASRQQQADAMCRVETRRPGGHPRV